eukprot:gene2169-biopygen18478
MVDRFFLISPRGASRQCATKCSCGVHELRTKHGAELNKWHTPHNPEHRGIVCWGMCTFRIPSLMPDELRARARGAAGDTPPTPPTPPSPGPGAGPQQCPMSVVRGNAPCQWSAAMPHVSGPRQCPMSVVRGNAPCQWSAAMPHVCGPRQPHYCQWSAVMLHHVCGPRIHSIRRDVLEPWSMAAAAGPLSVLYPQEIGSAGAGQSLLVAGWIRPGISFLPRGVETDPAHHECRLPEPAKLCFHGFRRPSGIRGRRSGSKVPGALSPLATDFAEVCFTDPRVTDSPKSAQTRDQPETSPGETSDQISTAPPRRDPVRQGLV